jgi:hypothetical protein
MNPAQKIIEKFGSQSELARLIGKRQSTVQHWASKGIIPAKWQGTLLALATERGISLSADDFVHKPQIPIVSPDVIVPEVALTVPDEAQQTNFLFYTSSDGSNKVRVAIGDETVWASQRGMADIFGTSRENITVHLGNIFQTGELDENSVCKEFLLTASDGKKYKYKLYNLDAIISIGYRVNSYQATKFRKWATTILREYLIKGYALDDERLKQGKELFGKDYFDDLLERIREIRASERRFYQKITDIYSQCSIDYDKNAPITKQFYAYVQDKLHYAIHGHTAAELIELRADSSKPNMGLYSWKNEGKKGKVTKVDVTVGKNYLTQEELDNMNRLVSMYLDTAENFARRHKAMTMRDWLVRLDNFLEFNAYEVLKNHGSVKRDDAERHALAEYEIFRVKQDIEYKSDFDHIVDQIKTRKRLPNSDDLEK